MLKRIELRYGSQDAEQGDLVDIRIDGPPGRAHCHVFFCANPLGLFGPHGQNLSLIFFPSGWSRAWEPCVAKIPEEPKSERVEQLRIIPAKPGQIERHLSASRSDLLSKGDRSQGGNNEHEPPWGQSPVDFFQGLALAGIRSPPAAFAWRQTLVDLLRP